tara:strand:+ start:546 stop:1424 length:879 start_codon:yes stop_codon:yes gene_type:complete
MKHITIILPIYNDWKSLKILLGQIETIVKQTNYKFSILLVNDNSSLKNTYDLNKNNFFKEVKIINLKKNVGSQKAIATALKYISEKKGIIGKKFIIMDSDGEDDPKKIINIINILTKNKNVKVITLNRTIRKESFIFSVLYEMHLFLTFLITLNYIRFGNYSFLDLGSVKKIAKKSDLWLAYSATINKFFHNKLKIVAPRKKRISGKSKMSYFNLFKHSINIQAVFRSNIILCYSFYSMLFLIILNYKSLPLFFIIIPIIFCLHFLVINFLIKEEIPFKNCLNNIVSIKKIR